jgi:signal transduction histidine kinase
VIEVLEHTRALFAGKATTSAGAAIEISVERAAVAARKLPPVTADREQLGRTLLNLVKNAIEAMPPGGGRITLEAEREVRGARDGVVLIVRDTGLGMPEEVRGQIFTPYFTTKKEGTGLGLAIVDRIVQEHQGAIDVESRPGVGTTFRVWLPSAA